MREKYAMDESGSSSENSCDKHGIYLSKEKGTIIDPWLETYQHAHDGK